MSLWKRLTGEFIDVIEFLDPTHNTLVHRFERSDNEIKNGAKLIVREGQQAVFVNMGTIADTFTPGTYTLETKNLPILSKLQNWHHGFQSPFKAEVYFVSTRQFTDLKWGTQNPVTRRDPEFGPVRMRAFGTFAMRVIDPPHFLREISGTSGRFKVEDIFEQIRNTVVARFADTLGESKIPLLDMASNQDELGVLLATRTKPDMDALGIELTRVLVENISLPPEVEAALDKRASIGVVGNLQQYMGYQMGTAMEKAASNPGGGSMTDAALGIGVAMQAAKNMGSFIESGSAPPPLGAAPTLAFFVGLGGQPAGPFDMPTLGSMARSGQIARDTLVWRQGMNEWLKANQVAELASIFASPPPLPGTLSPPPLPRA